MQNNLHILYMSRGTKNLYTSIKEDSLTVNHLVKILYNNMEQQKNYQSIHYFNKYRQSHQIPFSYKLKQPIQSHRYDRNNYQMINQSQIKKRKQNSRKRPETYRSSKLITKRQRPLNQSNMINRIEKSMKYQTAENFLKFQSAELRNDKICPQVQTKQIKQKNINQYYQKDKPFYVKITYNNNKIPQNIKQISTTINIPNQQYETKYQTKINKFNKNKQINIQQNQNNQLKTTQEDQNITKSLDQIQLTQSIVCQSMDNIYNLSIQQTKKIPMNHLLNGSSAKHLDDLNFRNVCSVKDEDELEFSQIIDESTHLYQLDQISGLETVKKQLQRKNTLATNEQVNSKNKLKYSLKLQR